MNQLQTAIKNQINKIRKKELIPPDLRRKLSLILLSSIACLLFSIFIPQIANSSSLTSNCVDNQSCIVIFYLLAMNQRVDIIRCLMVNF